MKSPIRHIRYAASMLAVLLVVAGCAPGMQGSTVVAPLPQPLADVKVAYVNKQLYAAASPTRNAVANFLNPYANHPSAGPSTTEGLEKHQLSRVDDKVLRLAPAILQQQGLKGDVTSFVTIHRADEVAEAAAATAKARGSSVEYWLFISPLEARAGGLITNVEFRAVLSNIVDRKVYWQAEYSTPGAPVDDAQVQAMLTAFIQGMAKQP